MASPNLEIKTETPEETLKRVYRRLSFKMPVTFRYGFAIGFFCGVPAAFITGRPSSLLKWTLYTTIGFGLGTCYEEFGDIGMAKYRQIVGYK